MTENVHTLSVVPHIQQSATLEGLLKKAQDFLADQELLSDYSEDDIELEAAHSDEVRVGPCTAFEKEAFILSALLAEIRRDLIVQIETDNTESITAIMRRDNVVFSRATHIFMEEIHNRESMSDPRFVQISQTAILSMMLQSMFDFSVRSRSDEWSKQLIVRFGFNIYRYG